VAQEVMTAAARAWSPGRGRSGVAIVAGRMRAFKQRWRNALIYGKNFTT
jgi:hypothetical protein